MSYHWCMCRDSKCSIFGGWWHWCLNRIERMSLHIWVHPPNLTENKLMWINRVLFWLYPRSTFNPSIFWAWESIDVRTWNYQFQCFWFCFNAWVCAIQLGKDMCWRFLAKLAMENSKSILGSSLNVVCFKLSQDSGYQNTTRKAHVTKKHIGSMFGIYTYIWLIFMANVGKYAIHGSHGACI